MFPIPIPISISGAICRMLSLKNVLELEEAIFISRQLFE
jgi:hypothetical protein